MKGVTSGGSGAWAGRLPLGGGPGEGQGGDYVSHLAWEQLEDVVMGRNSGLPYLDQQCKTNTTVTPLQPSVVFTT